MYPLSVNCYHSPYCIIIVDVFIMIILITGTTPGRHSNTELEGGVSRIGIFFSLKPDSTPPASIYGLRKTGK